MDPILQLTSRGAVAHAAPETLAALAATFRAECCARVLRLIEPALLAHVQAAIERSRFSELRHGTIASELCMERNTTLGLLHFLANDATVFDVVQRITGVAGLRCFVGRVYRRAATAGHHDSWHSDVHPDRRVGMSINLSTAPYEGGVFEIRDRTSGRTLAALPNTGPGDALLFAIDDRLEHRVTTVSGSAAKTAFAGWFGTTRDYLGTLAADPHLPDE
jgi:2-oxoglutarate-Fe(II)-dependent oxygenase superfamily protein